MSKKNFKGVTGSLLGTTKSEEPKAPALKETAKVSTTVIKKTSQQGTKENETRATFIVKQDALEKLKAISRLEGFLIKEVVNEALDRFIIAYEKKKGTIETEKVLHRKKIL